MIEDKNGNRLPGEIPGQLSLDIPRPTKTRDAIDKWFASADELLAEMFGADLPEAEIVVCDEAEMEAMSHLTGEDCLRAFGVQW